MIKIKQKCLDKTQGRPFYDLKAGQVFKFHLEDLDYYMVIRLFQGEFFRYGHVQLTRTVDDFVGTITLLDAKEIKELVIPVQLEAYKV